MSGETLLKRVKWVLDSNISAYEIEKQTDIPRVSIGRYRNGKTLIINMTLETAMKLEKFGLDNGLFYEVPYKKD